MNLVSILLFLNLGGGEIIVVLLVALLFFGSKKVPDLARGLGRGMREFKDAMNGIQRELEQNINEVKHDSTVNSPFSPDDKDNNNKELKS